MDVRYGTKDDDLQLGTNASDIIYGLSGDDVIEGRQGDDIIFGGDGFDTINGGEGNDRIDGGLGKSSLKGGAGDDVLVARNGPIHGQAGNDTITSVAFFGSLQAHLFGGSGEDWFNLSFDPISAPANASNGNASFGHHVRGDPSSGLAEKDIYNFTNTANVTDIVVGRLEDFDPSRDELRIEGRLVSFSNRRPVFDHGLDIKVDLIEHNGNYLSSGSQPDSDAQQWLLIHTSTGGQIVYALEGARVITPAATGSYDGNQEFHFLENVRDFSNAPQAMLIDQQNTVPTGFDPSDWNIMLDTDNILADANAAIVGSQGNDAIAAGLNNDTVRAGTGDDYVWGGSGYDRLYGGAGDDAIYGGTGSDVLYGDDGDDQIYTGHGDDVVYGGNGSDWITTNGDGIEVFDGGRGSYDTVSFSNLAEGGAVVSLLLNQGTGGAALGDTFTGVENLTGSSQGDVLHGDAQRNVLRGLYGDDNLKGNGGNDRIEGGKGDDLIFGGSGHDRAIYAGDFEDFHLYQSEGFLWVEDRRTQDYDEGLDRLVNIEKLQFGDTVIAVSELDF